MARNDYDESLKDIRAALAAADMQMLRDALLTLNEDGRSALEQRLGDRAVSRLLQNARSVRRGSRGRVVMIHGIMGGKLGTVDATGDQDLVWVHVFRLIAGAIERFRLDDDGNSISKVVTLGLLDEYLPMVMELDRQWEVRPFAFDWRLDIDRSAGLLHDEIAHWANGEPTHIVAHSMGGLVARRFSQLHPQTWQAMADPDELKRGGRLVMLGTPNRGSFAIPFVVTGREPTVRKLERFDVKHNLAELLSIINTFVGSYQMLPSPNLQFGDDRLQFFTESTWGQYPVRQKNLQRGRNFQEEMDEVINPERLLYVAGYDQPTPFRVRVDGPGDFSYQETTDGDGRVPHELGLLPNVNTYYVPDAHGDLPKNERVLSAIHELLRDGSTSKLEAQLPAVRRHVRSRTWRKAADVAPDIPPAVDGILGTGSARRAIARITGKQRVTLESILVEDLVGGAPRTVESPRVGKRAPGAPPKLPRRSRPIKVEVMWGDIIKADGQVYAAGHYQGVMPQRGELALDRAVSKPDADSDELLISSLTRRGVVRGAVGDVYFFPWARKPGTLKTMVIAGMGHPGTFGRSELRRLARSLTESIVALPGVSTVNTLLIGSGAGNLPIRTALEGLLAGMADALAVSAQTSTIHTVRIVELDRMQAEQILQTLQDLNLTALTEGVVDIQVGRDVITGDGGSISEDLVLSVVLTTIAQAHGGRKNTARRKSVTQLLRGIPENNGLRDQSTRTLKALAVDGKADLLRAAARLRLGRKSDDDREQWKTPTRVSFIHKDRGLRAAALTDTAVVPERFIGLDWALIDEIVSNMRDPEDLSKLSGMASLLARMVVPRDFRELFSNSEITIFEIDRTTARIHWEMIELLRSDSNVSTPIALERQVARQLRTSYSPAVPRGAETRERLRALVIGDPGDPKKGHGLPGAQREAIEVVSLLRERDVEVVALIGAPGNRESGKLREFAPATRLEVLRLLSQEQFDVLHYAGHGDFDADDPEAQAGWLFADGLLTSRELERIDAVPALVVANACLSGLVSDAYAAGTKTSRLHVREEYLLPGLADEFFKRGVRNYVGTAWEVSDLGAISFAKELYSALLPDPSSSSDGTTLGRALLQARRALKTMDANFGALWAAYQHYGDPDYRVAPARARS